MCGVVVITTAQLHSTKSELRFGAGSYPVRGVSEIRNGEDLWQWSRLEIRLNAFRRSTIPQKQFIIIIITINIIIITIEHISLCILTFLTFFIFIWTKDICKGQMQMTYANNIFMNSCLKGCFKVCSPNFIKYS